MNETKPHRREIMDRIEGATADAGEIARVLRDEELEAVNGGGTDDRPTEEVAFYYNRIAFGW